MKKLQDALVAIRRSPYQSVLALLVITVTFFVGYIFSLFLFGTDTILKFFETRPQVIAFFEIQTASEDVNKVAQAMRDKSYVSEVNIVSKEQALDFYKQDHKDNPLLLELVTADILPASIEVSGRDVDSLSRIQEDLKSVKGIEEDAPVLRQQMVEHQLAARGIRNTKVLSAFLSVPRQRFVPDSFQGQTYEDHPIGIGYDQTISQPYTVAYQSQLLEVKPFEKVLEIGTGSAYQAAILAKMGAQVFTIERQKKLFESNKPFDYLKKFPGIKFFYGDGYEGLPSFAPFDKILITAAAPEIPEKLVKQLKIGGMMVLPLGSGEVQQMMRLTKLSNGAIKEEVFDNFSFVPMLEGKK